MEADERKAYKRTSVLTDFVCVYEKKVAVVSFFDTGKNPARIEPERFYHGVAFCGKKF
ncbi:hypothetical protein [Parablautia intestinalis]|uniref:hypothetical protein n=1 Tax=Parablautia intestinalis TaxID=2320100 RepID=UPI00259C8E2A|nr:hypothetical protein [Parablautia intestinalis]